MTIAERELPRTVLPDLPATVPTPPSTLEALQDMHAQNHELQKLFVRFLALAELERQTPEMKTITINPGNNGQYQVVDPSAWAAKSIGVLNPENVPVFIGVGGVSARPLSGAPSCPGASALTLPVEARDIEFGCDPAVLLTNTVIIYVFRYVTVQPLVLRTVP